MVFNAQIHKDGKFWLAEIEALDAMTQARTKKLAIQMLKDWIRSSLDDEKAPILVREEGPGEFIVTTEDTREVIALLLQRQRLKNGLTIREVAQRLGLKSHTGYAQYEQGRTEPSLSQLNRILDAISPGRKAQLKIS